MKTSIRNRPINLFMHGETAKYTNYLEVVILSTWQQSARLFPMKAYDLNAALDLTHARPSQLTRLSRDCRLPQVPVRDLDTVDWLEPSRNALCYTKLQTGLSCT